MNIFDALEDLERERVCEVSLTIKGETETVEVNIVEQKLFDDIIIFMEGYSKSVVEFVEKREKGTDLELIYSIGDKTINFLKEIKVFLDKVYDQLCEIGEDAISFIEKSKGVEDKVD